MSDPARVFVTRRLPGDALERLLASPDARVEVWEEARPPSPDLLRARAPELEGLLCTLEDRIDAAWIAAASHLRVISSYSVGLDHVDLEAATARGIPVGHTPGVLAETTADLAFGLLLAVARRLPEAERYVRAGQWDGWSPDLLLGRDVHGATLGLLGLGAIGQAVARRAQGFGMRVLGWTRSGREVEGVESVSRERLLAESDFLSVHVALTPETHGMLGEGELATMKSTAYLVNTARGGIVDEIALSRALAAGTLAGAALDVFETEPLPATSALAGAPNLVLAPHLGSATVATRARMADLAVDNLLAGIRGEPLPRRAGR